VAPQLCSSPSHPQPPSAPATHLKSSVDRAREVVAAIRGGLQLQLQLALPGHPACCELGCGQQLRPGRQRVQRSRPLPLRTAICQRGLAELADQAVKRSMRLHGVRCLDQHLEGEVCQPFRVALRLRLRRRLRRLRRCRRLRLRRRLCRSPGAQQQGESGSGGRGCGATGERPQARGPPPPSNRRAPPGTWYPSPNTHALHDTQHLPHPPRPSPGGLTGSSVPSRSQSSAAFMMSAAADDPGVLGWAAPAPPPPAAAWWRAPGAAPAPSAAGCWSPAWAPATLVWLSWPISWFMSCSSRAAASAASCCAWMM